MPLVPDECAVEHLAAAGVYPSLHDRVHSWHLDSAEHDLDTGVFEHGVEKFRVLAIAVPDQEPWPAVGVLQIHNEVPGGLDDPGCGGVRGCSQDPDATGGVFDDGQDELARAV
jgi:hypothetical protein